jgi:hypothetical protein
MKLDRDRWFTFRLPPKLTWQIATGSTGKMPNRHRSCHRVVQSGSACPTRLFERIGAPHPCPVFNDRCYREPPRLAGYGLPDSSHHACLRWQVRYREDPNGSTRSSTTDIGSFAGVTAIGCGSSPVTPGIGPTACRRSSRRCWQCRCHRR